MTTSLSQPLLRHGVRRQFLVWWCAATEAAWITGVLLLLYLREEIPRDPLVGSILLALVILALPAVIGIVCSTLQGITLRAFANHSALSILWIIAGALGWSVALFASALGFCVALLALAVGWSTAFLAINPFAGSLLAGFAQWLIIRRRVSKAAWWILIAGLSWLFAYALLAVLTKAELDLLVEADPFLLALAGLVPSVLTAGGMTSLLSRTASRPTSEDAA